MALHTWRFQLQQPLTGEHGGTELEISELVSLS